MSSAHTGSSAIILTQQQVCDTSELEPFHIYTAFMCNRKWEYCIYKLSRTAPRLSPKQMKLIRGLHDSMSCVVGDL